MFTIAVTSAKGGAGKSTVSTLLALGLKELSGGSLDVGIMDYDTQLSTANTLKSLKVDTIREFPRGTRFTGTRDEPDFLIIDTAPTLENIIGGGVPPSDFYLIPTGPSSQDWLASARTWAYLREHVRVPVYILFNGITQGSMEEREKGDIIASMTPRPKVLKTVLHRRMVFTRLPILGWGELCRAKQHKALGEVESLIREIARTAGFTQPRNRKPRK